MRILIPVDGSSPAEYALGAAAQIAHQAAEPTTLVLLRAETMLPMMISPAGMGVPITDVPVTDREECERYLAELLLRPTLAGITVETHVAVGPAAAAICEHAHLMRVDLIMMTSHGRSGIARALLGSVAESVARDSTIPTLIVREGAAKHTQLPPTRILVPLDGSSFAEAVLDPASQLARGWHAEMRLLRVVHSPTSDSASDREQIAAARAYLEAIKGQLECDGITTSLTVMMGMPQQQIMAATAHEQYPCEMLAVATHERTPLEKLEDGGVTAYLLRHFHHSMLIVHPQSDKTRMAV